jgi:hypothetical protein
MPKTYEYEEGPKALENFKKGMATILKVPKDAVVKAEKKARKKRAKKTSTRDLSRDSGGEA